MGVVPPLQRAPSNSSAAMIIVLSCAVQTKYNSYNSNV